MSSFKVVGVIGAVINDARTHTLRLSEHKYKPAMYFPAQYERLNKYFGLSIVRLKSFPKHVLCAQSNHFQFGAQNCYTVYTTVIVYNFR